jgi:hypothetical protein
MNSVKDLIVRNNIDEVVSDDVQFVNKKGDIYIPLSKRYRIGSNEGSLRFPRFIPGGYSNDPLFYNPMYFQDFKSKYLSPEVTTITYNRTLSIPTMIKQLAEEEKIYGVIIQSKDGDYAINPLHPLVAFLIAADLLKYPDEGKLHIFEWKERRFDSVKEAMNNSSHIESYIKDYEKIFAMAPDIIKEPVVIKQRASIDNRDITALIEEPFVENINTVIKVIKNSEGSTNLTNIKSLVIPHQLIVDGTLSPYYGLSNIFSPTDSSITGYGLGPMVTGNISQSHDGGNRKYSSFQNSSNSGNVCTGSENSVVPKGWFTLSRVNLNSMYYSDVIDEENVFPFIKASKDISKDIWKLMEEESKQELEEAV